MKKTNTNLYGDILQMYVSNDKKKEWCNTPFFIEKNAIATNGHEMIFFDKNLAPNIAECTFENPLNITKYLDFTPNQNLILNKVSILKAIEPLEETEIFKVVGEDIECKECDGEGVVEWEYKSRKKDFECPICNGSGYEKEATSIPTGKFEKADFNYIDILGCRFNQKFVKKLIDISTILDNSEVVLIYQEESNKHSIFEISDVRVLIMPSHKDNCQSVILRIKK